MAHWVQLRPGACDGECASPMSRQARCVFCHHALNHCPLISTNDEESTSLTSIHIIRNPEDITRFPVYATLIALRSFEYEHKDIPKSCLRNPDRDDGISQGCKDKSGTSIIREVRARHQTGCAPVSIPEYHSVLSSLPLL